MEIIRTIEEMKKYISTIKLKNEQIGFVPTMGYFHKGHLSLMKEAKNQCDVVITSIFVNPLQFGPNEDFETYPRDENRDIQLAKETGVQAVFIPSVDELYPRDPIISLQLIERTDVLCGRTRPGHFNGVLTVLTKLFHIIEPDRVYFGLKDAQQAAVVEALISDMNFPIQLVGVETEREEDGLAKSSRNVYLSGDERKEAVWLYKALERGRKLLVDGEKNPAIIVKEVKNALTKNTNGTIDYVEMYNYPDLKPVERIDQQVILAIAVHFTKARLIDNMIFDESGAIIRGPFS